MFACYGIAASVAICDFVENEKKAWTELPCRPLRLVLFRLKSFPLLNETDANLFHCRL